MGHSPDQKSKTHAWIARAADSYLSESHRDHPGTGCPISALACEVARSSKQVRSLLTERAKSYFELLANLLPQDDARHDQN